MRLRHLRAMLSRLDWMLVASVHHIANWRKGRVHVTDWLVAHDVARRVGGWRPARVACRFIVNIHRYRGVGSNRVGHGVNDVLAIHALILLASVAVAACGGKTPPATPPTIVTKIETVEVRVPVPVKAEPPAELLAPLKVPLPVFVAPSDPNASSALTAEGERLLRALLEELLAAIESWRTWAATKADQ